MNNCVRLGRLVFAKTSLTTQSRVVRGLPSVLGLRLVHLSPPHSSEPGKTPQSYFDSFKTPPSNDIEVYYGPLSTRVRSVKVFSLMTSILGVCTQPMILQRAAELEASSAAIAATCGLVGFFTFVTPFLLHLVTKKYVTTVTWDEESDAYTASVYTLFLRRRDIRFKPGEAEVPEIGGMTTAIVRGVPLFMDARYFTDVYHYKRIMGYDKPIDFKLSPKKDVT